MKLEFPDVRSHRYPEASRWEELFKYWKDEGTVRIIPENADDIWILFNIIAVGDHIGALTSRKIVKGPAGATASSNSVAFQQSHSSRVFVKRLFLRIETERIDFDETSQSLRVSGPIISESKDVEIGRYHTIELTPRSVTTIHRRLWDIVALHRIKRAVDGNDPGSLAVILLNQGIANCYLITTCRTITVAKVNVKIPKNRSISSGYEKSVEKFYLQVLHELTKIVEDREPVCVIVAGPGLTRVRFLDWLWKGVKSGRNGTRILHGRSDIITSAHASTSEKQGLNEILGNKEIMKDIHTIRSMDHVAVLQKFYKMMKEDSDRTCYGPAEVLTAADAGAISTLLISDKVYRSADIQTRMRYANLVELISKGAKTTAYIISDTDVCGEQLQQLAGVAAILFFPIKT